MSRPFRIIASIGFLSLAGWLCVAALFWGAAYGLAVIGGGQ